MGAFYLAIAILCEVLGTTALKYSEGFTKLVPGISVVVCYIASFYFLSLVLKTIPVGVAYAIWSGVGIVLISVIGYFAFGQSLNLPVMVGIGLIISGVVVIQAYTQSF